MDRTVVIRIFNVLEQTESFYFMRKAYFIRNGGELLLPGKVFTKSYCELSETLGVICFRLFPWTKLLSYVCLQRFRANEIILIHAKGVLYKKSK